MTMDLSYISTVLNQTYQPIIADQLNQNTVLLSRVRKTLGGGKNIAFDAKVTRAAEGGSYASGADITPGATSHDVEVPAVLAWKRFEVPFKVSGDALAAANAAGPAAYANLFGKQIEDATRNLGIILGSQIYADGTGNSANDMDGLQAALLDSGTYAGISRVTYSAWRATVLANGGVDRALTEALMRQLERTIFTTCGLPPNLIVTTPAIVDKYEALFDSIKRQDVKDGTYNLGAKELTYKGIPIVRDALCPAGHMYFLSMNNGLSLEQLPPVPMAAGVVLSHGQKPILTADGNVGLQVAIDMLGQTGDAFKGYVKAYMNLKVERPNAHGVIKDIDEA